MRAIITLILWAACALLAPMALGQSEAEKQSDLARQHFRAVRELYRVAAWPEAAARDGFPFAAQAFEGWAGGEMRADKGLLSRPFTHTGAQTSAVASNASFLIEMRVTDSSREAQDMLVNWLAGLMTTRTMPTVRDWKMEIGDVGFIGPSGAGPRAIAWLAFTRGNIAVRLMATDARREPDLDLGAIALALDSAIQKRPVLVNGALPQRPEIKRLAPKEPALANVPRFAAELVALDVDVADPAAGTPHFEWIIGGPGQGYVEMDASGRWVLHRTSRGEITLTLEVTSSIGTLATRSY